MIPLVDAPIRERNAIEEAECRAMEDFTLRLSWVVENAVKQ